MRHVRMIVSFVFAIALLRATSATASQTIVTTCGTTCSGSCVLGQDLHCTSGTGVTMGVIGGTLDMQEFSIFCDAGSGCLSAVAMTGGNTIVFTTVGGANSTLEAGTPRIVGQWTNGVNCANQPDSAVVGITFHGFFTNSAIEQCSDVENNSIGGFPTEGSDVTFPGVTNIGIRINGSGADSQRVVTGNYIDGAKQPIVRLTASPNVMWTISNNTINHRNYGFGINQPAAITLLSAGPQQETVTGNIVTGDGTGVLAVSANHTGTYSGNVCRFPLVGCTSCVNSGKCTHTATVHSPLN